MADGKHCPACGQDVGYWPVALQIFWVRCPHCRTRLTYVARSGVLIVNVIGALLLIVVCGMCGAVVGFKVANEKNDLVLGVIAGLGVLVVLTTLLGCLVQMVLAPSMRTTRTLKLWGKPPPPPEDSW